jgi:hypothetical protein
MVSDSISPASKNTPHIIINNIPVTILDNFNIPPLN